MTDRIERLRERIAAGDRAANDGLVGQSNMTYALERDELVALLNALEVCEGVLRPAIDAIDEIVIDESEARRIHPPDHPMAGVLAGLNRALAAVEAFRRGGEK